MSTYKIVAFISVAVGLLSLVVINFTSWQSKSRDAEGLFDMFIPKASKKHPVLTAVALYFSWALFLSGAITSVVCFKKEIESHKDHRTSESFTITRTEPCGQNSKASYEICVDGLTFHTTSSKIKIGDSDSVSYYTYVGPGIIAKQDLESISISKATAENLGIITKADVLSEN